MGGPQAHDDAHWCATRGAQGDERLRRHDPSRLEINGACLHDHPAEGVGRDRTACGEKAAVTDCHEAGRAHVWEEPTDTLEDVKGGGAWAGTARFPVNEGDGTVCEAHDTLIGDGDLEARGAR